MEICGVNSIININEAFKENNEDVSREHLNLMGIQIEFAKIKASITTQSKTSIIHNTYNVSDKVAKLYFSQVDDLSTLRRDIRMSVKIASIFVHAPFTLDILADNIRNHLWQEERVNYFETTIGLCLVGNDIQISHHHWNDILNDYECENGILCIGTVSVFCFIIQIDHHFDMAEGFVVNMDNCELYFGVDPAAAQLISEPVNIELSSRQQTAFLKYLKSIGYAQCALFNLFRVHVRTGPRISYSVKFDQCTLKTCVDSLQSFVEYFRSFSSRFILSYSVSRCPSMMDYWITKSLISEEM